MVTRRCLSIVFLAILLGLMPRGAWAYQVDVHFNLTYVLCRLAGLDTKDALWISDANQSMDDNECTTAYLTGTWWLGHQKQAYYNGKTWHVLSDVNKREGTDLVIGMINIRFNDDGVLARRAILSRLDALWNRIPAGLPKSENERIRADIAMGQYLHARQDYFSHRQFTKTYTDIFGKLHQVNYLDPNEYLPYGPRAGHVPDGDGSTADYAVYGTLKEHQL
jgi:hypothetical protein